MRECSRGETEWGEVGKINGIERKGGGGGGGGCKRS